MCNAANYRQLKLNPAKPAQSGRNINNAIFNSPLTDWMLVTEFLFEYGLFFAKSATLVLALLVCLAALTTAVREARPHSLERLEVEPLNLRLEHMRDSLESEVLDEATLKKLTKQRRKAEKAKAKSPDSRARLYVLDFDGDLHASAVSQLREEITALLQVLRKEDEVLLRLESEGGLVHAYGLAASQLKRLRDRQIKLTVAVDKVAASGGYLMACIGDTILAAPFAIVGSIGVVAQIPNVHRLLKKHDIDVEVHTAGIHKRTLTMLGQNTDAAREKFREELEDTHALFKQFVTEHRPQVAIDQVSTGEHWFGTRALAIQLVDTLKTSDDYLLERAPAADLYAVRYRRKKPLAERLQVSLFKLLGALRAKAMLDTPQRPHFML